VSNELAKIQEEQNVLSISEFNAIIYREIQNQPAPFYERLESATVISLLTNFRTPQRCSGKT
jgi:hypothetical protein